MLFHIEKTLEYAKYVLYLYIFYTKAIFRIHRLQKQPKLNVSAQPLAYSLHVGFLNTYFHATAYGIF